MRSVHSKYAIVEIISLDFSSKVNLDLKVVGSLLKLAPLIKPIHGSTKSTGISKISKRPRPACQSPRKSVCSLSDDGFLAP
jgi:hypothetical protein